MSGIVGSKFNHRGSGLIGSLGTDGQHMLSSGAGKKHVFETVAAATAYDDNKLQTNVAILGFKIATNGSLAKYSLQDQTVDEFQDATGVDASASTNENLEGNTYTGRVVDVAGESLSAAGGTGGNTQSAGAGGAGSGGSAQGTGGAGGAGSTTGSAGSNGSSGAAGGGGGGSSSMANGGAGGNGDATNYSGGGGGGASDGDGDWHFTGGAGGSGYYAGGKGADATAGQAVDGVGVGGSGRTYGAGNRGIITSGRNNNGGGGGFPGGGGGGAAEISGDTSGEGGTGGVIMKYTNSGTQLVARFSGTSYTVPAGSTDLIVWVIGGGGGGGYASTVGLGGGGGGGMAKSNTFSDGVRIVTYSIGAGGTTGTTNPGATGGTTSATIGSNYTNEDLTLQSVDTTASTANPDYGDLIILMENVTGTATLNTDIKGFISEDSGVTFTEGTLVDEGAIGDSKIVSFHDLDISAQSGSAMCWKITTHNQGVSKRTDIHGVSLGWKA